jgi:hypothetical protein
VKDAIATHYFSTLDLHRGRTRGLIQIFNSWDGGAIEKIPWDDYDKGTLRLEGESKKKKKSVDEKGRTGMHPSGRLTCPSSPRSGAVMRNLNQNMDITQ